MIIQWTYGAIYQDNSYGGVQNYSGTAAALAIYLDTRIAKVVRSESVQKIIGNDFVSKIILRKGGGKIIKR